MKKNLVIVLAFFALISCNKKTETPVDVKPLEAKPQTEVEQLKNDSLSYNNGSCIKEITLKDSIATLIFTTNFDTYKELHPKSRVTPPIFLSWWSDEMGFNGTFVNNSAIVFRDYAFVNRVIIKVLYPNGIVHSTNLSRKEWESFYGMTTDQIRNDWENFGRNHFNKKRRTAFFDRFKK